ncbi:TetR/AcrR family transcriptional regulator [Streptomyces phaeochromogenes]|uniref:TetR/AcrR family transcriptional regulator n=1 Tax=Streptomyces phaeochromogenes TaxID=1923 RepID=A0ABZ1H1E9_STRPH|nr:TetR/AcrR family transcriptional regulator [Streptomyces phaeochromogenes]MCX5602429.1 TetR/AcrR family transcriptional regulator [Streptomyces phaeochromogenes]WRZ26796.1 TetR/AcrR family transcriptional regulator [Streptomyces phaeochromogenes]WSD12361.1 TetR/AcrR family transcriptional regulator [Streptomyces phaeochromogenes]WSJ10838.1 TetR/AcrR family transcriptional regulator [Streptomyces phaeochromogenes]
MTERRRTPASRRERPAKPALTREGIVATAVALMRAEGLEKVTMRLLAQELDTGPASLYVYVANTAELHAAVLDELLGEVDLDPAEGEGDWRDRLAGVLTSYSDMLFEHPALARSALTARPSGEHYLRLLERLLALLDEGGVPRTQAAWGVDVLLLFATATAAEQSTRSQATDAAEEWDALTRAIHGVAEKTHPHVHTLAASLLAGPPEDRMTWSLQVLINGITHTSTPTPAPTATQDTDRTDS